jgi:hypothetical protein
MSSIYKQHLNRDTLYRDDFKRHLSIYAAVVTLLWLIWAFSGGGYIWPVWTTIAWGIAVFSHYVSVFDPFHFRFS